MPATPAGLRPEEMIAAFTASSQRVVRAVLWSQVEEARLFGMSDIPWVDQVRAAIARLDASLGDRLPAAPAGLRRVK